MRNLPKALIVVAFFLLTFYALGDTIAIPDIEGDWVGGFKVEGKWVLFNARFKMEDGAMKADIDIPFENEQVLAQTIIYSGNSNVKFELPNGCGALEFDGKYDGTTISGNVRFAGKEGTFHLFRIVEANL